MSMYQIHLYFQNEVKSTVFKTNLYKALSCHSNINFLKTVALVVVECTLPCSNFLLILVEYSG